VYRPKRHLVAIAASFVAVVLLFVVGFHNSTPIQSQLLTRSHLAEDTQTRVVFHISSSDVELAKQMMEQVELVLNDYERKGRNIRVEVVANNQGIRLFQQGITPIQQQLSRLHDRYSNVVFAACANTMERFERLNREKIKIVPQVVIIRSGVSFVARRQQLGWAYIRV
jgi:intracellular sulfur oxidation DsrE/DsrF family protein